MDRQTLLKSLTEAEIVGLTIWAEARAEPLEGQIAVGNVIANRRAAGREKAWGLGWAGVCLHPSQFSCWNEGLDKNHLQLMKQVEYLADDSKEVAQSVQVCIYLAEGVIRGVFPDLSFGASHYFSPTAMVPKGSIPPWAHPPSKLTTVIGRHRFYKAR